MKNSHNLVAFLSVVVAIVVLSVISAWKNNPVDLAIMTGLIGVLGSFRPRGDNKVEVDQPANNPIPVDEVKA